MSEDQTKEPRRINLVYLAGPIDGLVNKEDAKPWREEVNKILALHGVTTYSPIHAFGPPTIHSIQQVRKINESAIANCDLLIALFPPGITTVGTAIECDYALSLGIPVAYEAGNDFWYIHGAKRMSIPEAIEDVIRFNTELDATE